MTIKRPNIRGILQGLAIFVVAIGLSFATFQEAQAQSGGDSLAVGGTVNNHARSGDLETRSPDGEEKTCSDYGVLTGAMVPCIMHSIETGGVEIAEEFADLLEPAVMAFFTLVIVFFGVKLLQGEGQVGPKALLLLVKFAFVVGFLQIMPSLIPQVHAVMRESTGIVSQVLADPADFNCEVSNYQKDDTDLLWAQMDCVLGKLFGFVVSDGSDEPNMLLAASGLGMLGGFVFSGAVGLFIFFAIMGVLFTLFQFVMKTVLAYINGFLIATILIIISPIFLPLSLMQATAQYFDKWWKGILAAILMPVIITGYVMLALMLYDRVLLDDDSAMQKLFDADYMETIQVMTEQECSAVVGNSQNTQTRAAEQDENVSLSAAERLLDPNVMNRINQLTSGNSAVCFEHADINMASEDMEELFINLIKLMVTTLVIAEGFKVIQQSVRNITGSSMVAAAIEPVSTMETKMRDAMNSAKQGMQNAVGTNADGQRQRVADMSGADFVRNIPRVLEGGAEPFGLQITRPEQ